MPLALAKGIFLLWLLPFQLSGQSQNPVVEDIKSAFSEKPEIDFKLETRNSFIASRHAGVLSFRLGLNFDDRIRTGLGYNFLITTVFNELTVTNSVDQREVLSARFKMRYINVYGEYRYYNKNRVELIFHLLGGLGSSNFRYEDAHGVSDKTRNRFVLVYEPYMSGDYRVFKCLGIGAGLGYRLVYSPDRFSRTRLNSPIYIVKTKVYLQELYEALR